MLIDAVLDSINDLPQHLVAKSMRAVAFRYITEHDQIYDIQQVYDHMWAHVSYDEEAVLDIKDFPAVVPPADAAWFECTAKWGRRIAGLLLVDYDLADDEDWGLCKAQNPVWADAGEEKRAEQRWLVRLIGMVNMEPRRAAGVLPFQAYLYVGYDGALVGYATNLIDDDVTEGKDPGAVKRSGYAVDHIAHTVVNALCFMNARGTLVDRSCQQPRPERRRREKAGLKPAVRFNTVNIRPLLTRYASAHAAPRGSQPFHWVRGNFARYTEDAPLFGKYVGTVYRPLHAAGKKSDGQVVKSYTVEAS